MTSHIAKLHIEKKGLQMSTLSKRVCQSKPSKSSNCKRSICYKESSQKGYLNEHIVAVQERRDYTNVQFAIKQCPEKVH